MCTDLRPRFFTPRWTAPLAPSHFFSKLVFGQLRRPNAPLQTVMDKMHTMDSLLWATDTAKSKKKGSQNVHPAPKMRAKIQKKTPTCVAVVALIASKKARTPSSSTLAAAFSIAGAHPALCFSPPPFTVVKETWKPVLPVYTSQKQAKTAHVVLRTCGPWPSNMHSAWCLAARQPASPACRSTQTTGFVTSIVVLRFARTPLPLWHSWKEFFSFRSGNGGIARALRDLSCSFGGLRVATIDEA